MGAIAQRRVASVLAAAEPHPFFLFGRVFNRRKSCSLVGAVAEWLAVTAATGAPEVILAALDQH